MAKRREVAERALLAVGGVLAIISVAGMLPADPGCLYDSECGALEEGLLDVFGAYIVLLAIGLVLLVAALVLLAFRKARARNPKSDPRRRAQREEKRAAVRASKESADRGATPPGRVSATEAPWGWHDDGDFVRWWNGSEWTDDFRPASRGGPLLRFLIPGGPIRSPIEWIWIAILSFIAAVVLGLMGFRVVLDTFQSAFEDESSFETATSSWISSILLLVSIALGILASVSLLVGIIGLGVRSGVSGALRAGPPRD